MPTNIFANKPNVVIAKQTISFVNAGITALNTAVIYLVDNPLRSYVPGRLINSISGFEKDKGYYIIPLTNQDQQKWLLPPLVTASAGIPLIIFTGESNSMGYALNSQATIGELSPQPNVKILNNNNLTFETMQIGINSYIGNDGGAVTDVHAMELQLANRVNAGTFVPAPLYLVKSGQGSSKIADWDVGATFLGYNLWQLFMDRVDEAFSLLNTLTGSNPSPYIFYTQGINDGIAGTNINTWITKTIAHFEKIRARYGFCPIVMTKIMAPFDTTYNPAMEYIASQMQGVFVVETSDCTQRDQYHWDYAGMKIISNRMIDTFLNNYAI